MSKNISEREERRIKTSKTRHGNDIFRKAGKRGGTSLWKKIKAGDLQNPL